MSRLVIVSNRVGSGRGSSAGGLTVALGEAVRDRHGIWFGWSGKLSDSIAAGRKLSTGRWRRFSLAQLDLSRQEYDEFYLGYANRCLWPVLHFRADLMDYRAHYYDAYRKVNRRFAALLAPLLEPDDLIWVHDFHLLPLATELRALGVTQRIGLFLHTPFPPSDILMSLPSHETLVRNLFDFDLAGFQTLPDLRRFTTHMMAEHGARADGSGISAFRRQLEVGAFPVGIDVKQFHGYSFSAAGEREFRRMRDALRGRQQIIGVDRLDYSKGLRRRMEAFELLLENYPEMQGQIEFMQVSPLSRSELKAYRDFRRELEQAALSINTRFGQVDWTPVRYINRTLTRQALAGIYRASRIGLVTPMRDGMNLVAKEYVAAQDPDDPGVLVLSRFAGAAQQMDAALLINPYDAEEIAATLHKARAMGLAERRQRHAALLTILQRDGTREWAAAFIRCLSQTQRVAAAA